MFPIVHADRRDVFMRIFVGGARPARALSLAGPPRRRRALDDEDVVDALGAQHGQLLCPFHPRRGVHIRVPSRRLRKNTPARGEVALERPRGLVERARGDDPVLPRDVVRDEGRDGAEGPVAADAHLVDDEERGEGGVVVLDVQRDGFAVVLLELVGAGVVDEDELLALFFPP
jgi:hypothetical protein